MKEHKDLLIIGAGPAGLTFAYYLLNKTSSYKITILEKNSQIAGLSTSYKFDGNMVDVGGHRFFTDKKEIQCIWDGLLASQFKEVRRFSHILFKGNTYEYPIRISLDMLRNFGIKESIKVILNYLYSSFSPRQVNTLEDYYINQFGNELYSLFFKEYTMKLWGIDAKQISPDWGEQRVNNLSLLSFLSKCGLGKKADKRTLIKFFKYPEKGSIQMWNAMSSEIVHKGGTIKLEHPVDYINFNKDKKRFSVICNGGLNKFEADVVVSSMPLKNLVLQSNCFTKKAYKVALNLNYRSMIIVAVVFNNKFVGEKWKYIQNDQWVYIQQHNCVFGRLQLLNNWSEQMVSNSTDILLEMEIFCDENDNMWVFKDYDILNMCVADLTKLDFVVSEICVDSWLIKRIPYAYPVYDDGYNYIDAIYKEVDMLDNLYCIGRNGQHKYNNMDDSMETAIEAVEMLLNKNM